MLLAPYARLARALVLHDRPVYVHYAVTSRCNLRCRSCTIWRRGRTEDTSELSLLQIKELADVLARLGCAQVSLGGGEPAMREDLPEIVRAFLAQKIRVRVLTNGVALTPAVARRLLDAGLRELSFSLDSLDRCTQEQLDSDRGTSDTRLKNLCALAGLLPRRGTLCVINTVVSPANFRELAHIARLADRLGFFSSFIPVHLARFSTEAHRFYGQAPELRFEAADAPELRAVYHSLLALKRRGGRIINSSAFLRRSPDYLLLGRADWPCRAGEMFLSVSPQGGVSACHAFEGQQEIHYTKLARTFCSPSYRQEVRRLVTTCEGCLRPCWAEIGFLLLQPRALLEMVWIQVLAHRPRPALDPGVLRRELGLPGGAA